MYFEVHGDQWSVCQLPEGLFDFLLVSCRFGTQSAVVVLPFCSAASGGECTAATCMCSTANELADLNIQPRIGTKKSRQTDATDILNPFRGARTVQSFEWA